ncbi:MAG TPA: malectin domain-containing carbohydrate-binding protein [Pilimelia sp.]|nr:malectin domain-containing carbohydrate-binding protein [Pilimelia sp.]
MSPRTRTRLARRIAGIGAGVLLSAAAVVAGPAAPAGAAVQATFHVSPSGSDGNSGTAEAPVRTLTRARDLVRPLAANMTGDIVVNLHRGDYPVTSPIQFTERDSGTNGFEVIYQSADEVGSARLIGGQRVTGWTRHSGNVWRAQVGTGVRFDTLYENGRRAVKARTPNLKELNGLSVAKADYLFNDAGSSGSTVVRYKSGQLNPGGWNLRDAQLYIWPGFNWFAEQVPITSINAATRDIRLSQETRYPLGGANKTRFVVQGVLQLLDTPGEFHLDTGTGTLYYWPRDGAPDAQEIIAPRVKTILSFTGASEASRVHDITFSGVTLEATDFTPWYRHAWPAENGSGENHQHAIYDRQIEMTQHRTGMVFMRNTDHLTITRSHLKNSGYSAVYMLFHNQNNTVSASWIEHAGYAGVFLEGKYPGEGDVLRNNTLTNNLVHDVGEIVGHGAGYLLMQASNNELSHSEIYNSSRFATYLGGWRELPNNVLYTRNNQVHHLNIHDVMQDSQDGSAIYTFGMSTDSDGPFQVNTYNQILINHSFMHPQAGLSQGETTLPGAVFCDEGSYGQRFSNVKAVNIQHPSPFKTNKSGATVLSNVSWQSGFNEAAMDLANIGVRSTFPYQIFRINVGSRKSHVDFAGKFQHADQYFTDGTASSRPNTVAGADDQAVYQNYRFGRFSYRIPLANGVYRVFLKFVEPFHTTAGARVFTVRAEGATVLANYDVFAATGGQFRAIQVPVTATVTDGVLNLDFIPSRDQAILAGLAAIRQ